MDFSIFSDSSSRADLLSKFSRRKFLSALAAASLVGVSAALIDARYFEPFQYEITERKIFIKDLPANFEGFRLTQITDLHHSGFVPLEEIARVVQLAQSTAPDLFVLTGDYSTENNHRYFEPCVEVLSHLQAAHGTFAVLGNHDQRNGSSALKQALKRRGIALLDNQNTRLAVRDEELQLIGIDDCSWAQTDWTKARRAVDFTRPTILLSHQPQVFDFPQSQQFSLILSGHTHGGQISFPLVGAPARAIKQFRYISGLFQRQGSRSSSDNNNNNNSNAGQLYVSRGTGMVGLPLRFGVRPEIAVIKLMRA